jgi:hypothetical protein
MMAAKLATVVQSLAPAVNDNNEQPRGDRRVAFAEFRGEAILEFRPISDDLGWVLWQVHVARNGEVSRALADAAEAKCSAVGIGHRHGRGRGAAARLSAVREWLQQAG